ncbi:MAG: response regulator [Myxococcales bacterium]|nr:response regulator [Myxococcales bacterium]
MTPPRILVIDDSPTILKVVHLVLSKAGFVVDVAETGEEGLELARKNAPGLILLDFVMPKMNGYQVCRALAAEDSLSSIPVVLMSAKGDQVGERFVKIVGIVDYITKPFSPEAITAVVQHTVSKYPGDDDTASRAIALAETTEADTQAGVRAIRVGKEARDHALQELRELITEAIAPRLAGLLSLVHAAQDAADDSEEITIDEDAVASAARSVLDDETLQQLFISALPAFENAAMGPSLRGDLHVIPIAEVLQLLDTQQQSGILQLTRGEAKIEVFFRDGQVDMAIARELSNEYLLGRYMLDTELISQEDLTGFLESRGSGSKLLGSQLVQLGYISDSELKLVLQQQTRGLIYEVLRWSFGSFQFLRTRELPAVAIDAMLGLDVEGILMEGFRRVGEWHLIEREINDFEMVFLRNEDSVAQMGRGRLTREELSVLELVNGKNTVKELIRESRMGSYEVSKMLFRLLSIKLIRKRVMPIAT